MTIQPLMNGGSNKKRLKSLPQISETCGINPAGFFCYVIMKTKKLRASPAGFQEV
jgi:hypothetical protein